MLAFDELQAFVARLLGWSDARAVDSALRSIDLARRHEAELVLCGDGDLVPIAWALHRRTLGREQPFVVCDPRRRNTPASTRSPENRASALAALAVAPGGSLCVRARRLPRDFPALVAQLRSIRNAQLVVCADPRDVEHPFLVRPGPIQLPPLAARGVEIDRVIAEFAADAITEFNAPPSCFNEVDHAWVRQHAATIGDVDKATLRLVALRTSRSINDAAARLGMAAVSLSRWIDRRELHLQARRRWSHQ